MNFVHKWPAGGPTARNGAPEGAAGPADGDPGVGAHGEALLTGLVLASLGWTTLCLGGYRPETMLVTVTLNAAALIAWLGLEAWRRRGLQLRLPALAMLPFLVYAAVNAGWVTPVPWLGWQDWLGWAQMAAVFWVVLHGIRGDRAREALLWGLVALGCAAVAMAGYQRLADPKWLMLGREQAAQFLGRSSGPFGIPNSLAAFLNLVLPPMLALALQRGAGPAQRIFCGYLAALFACGVLLTVSRGAWLALGVALAAWPLLVGHSPRRRWLGGLGVCALLVLIAAAIYVREPQVKERVDQLARNRGEISREVMWRAGWRLFQDSPLLGTGAGSYGVLLERHRPMMFWDSPRWAHNDYLNTLSDYGTTGLLLSFGVLAVFGWQAMRRLAAGAGSRNESTVRLERWGALRTGLAIGLLAFGLQLFVDFNLKIPALAQVAAALLALETALFTEDAPASLAARSVSLGWCRRGRQCCWRCCCRAGCCRFTVPRHCGIPPGKRSTG